MAVGNVTMGLFYCFLGGDWAQEVPEGILLQGVGADLVVGKRSGPLKLNDTSSV